MRRTALLALAQVALAALVGCGPEGLDEDTDTAEFEAKSAKRIEVSLYNQELRAFERGELVYWYYAVTGSSESPTPAGNYRILSKHHEYRSQKYDADMPYTMFFSNTGMAIHAAYGVAAESWVKWAGNYVEAFDWFGSHGCVRLSEQDAGELFEWASVGASVRVMDDRDMFEVEPDACSVEGIAGSCLDIAQCNYGYVSVPGHCSGPLSIQCCVPQ